MIEKILNKDIELIIEYSFKNKENLKNSLIDESFLKVVFLEIFLLFISSNHPEMCSLLNDKTEILYFLFIKFTNSCTSAIYALLVFNEDIFSEIIISL